MSEWQPIETAPKDGEWWLVWDSELEVPVVVEQRMTDGTFWTGDWEYKVVATYWMPLPPPPMEQPK